MKNKINDDYFGELIWNEEAWVTVASFCNRTIPIEILDWNGPESEYHVEAISLAKDLIKKLESKLPLLVEDAVNQVLSDSYSQSENTYSKKDEKSAFINSLILLKLSFSEDVVQLVWKSSMLGENQILTLQTDEDANTDEVMIQTL